MNNIVVDVMQPKAIQESSVYDYIILAKPRVMSLVVFSSIAGLIMGPNNIGLIQSFIVILCICLASAASAAINMWYDRDIDSVMIRTKDRPIVTGKVPPDEALAFGIIFSFFSVYILYVCINTISAILTLLAILIYVFIYTIWLKRRSIHNIVIGGASGAIPPMIGYGAAGGGIDLVSLSMFLIIFLWTPPHFWSLALLRKSEYAKCNVPMLPVVKGDYYTKIQIIIYAILTVIASIIPYMLGVVGLTYFISSLILGLYFIYIARGLLRDSYKPYYIFGYSIFYLFAIFLVMILDKN